MLRKSESEKVKIAATLLRTTFRLRLSKSEMQSFLAENHCETVVIAEASMKRES
jgi:hypothetical protein